MDSNNGQGATSNGETFREQALDPKKRVKSPRGRHRLRREPRIKLTVTRFYVLTVQKFRSATITDAPLAPGQIVGRSNHMLPR